MLTRLIGALWGQRLAYYVPDALTPRCQSQVNVTAGSKRWRCANRVDLERGAAGAAATAKGYGLTEQPATWTDAFERASPAQRLNAR